MRKDFGTWKDNNKLVPCRLDGDCSDTQPTTSSRVFFFLRSLNTKPRILLYNPLPEDRFWCGKRIWGGGGTLEINDYPAGCNDSQELLPYVFSSHPPTLSKGGPPVELFWNTDDFYGMDNIKPEPFPCSVPCKSAGEFTVLNTINVRNTKWEITLSMEGEQYYSQAHIRVGGYRDYQFYATTSFRSEIPVPYFSWSEYNIQHPAVDFRRAIKGASYLAQNCDSLSNRDDLVEKLIKTTSFRVDALSSCLHNADPPPGVDMSNKTDVMKEYLFHLAFENQRSPDYITEKLWGSLASGTLPVYYGAPNIKEHAPPNSIIVVDDFSSPQELADYLIRLSNDKALYESYHKWRYQPIDQSFASKYAFTHTHSTCRACKWAFATRHGLSWNHSRQEIEEPYIPHKTCRNKVGLVGHPFKEYWLSGGDDSRGNEAKPKALHVMSEDREKTCKLTARNREIVVDHGALRRKVFDHDGVTDFLIDVEKDGTYILKLETPIVAKQFFELNEQVRWLQDSQSRMTVLTTSNHNVSMMEQGAFQIPILSTTRVRIIVENVDHFHNATRKVPSYFGDLMTRDFYSPVEAYRMKT
jgi:hypothetical protein